MCSLEPTEKEWDKKTKDEAARLLAAKASRTCVKCKTAAPVMLVRDTPYCRECFMNMFHHKMRTTMAKGKADHDAAAAEDLAAFSLSEAEPQLRRQDKQSLIAVALSGGTSSMVMLQSLLDPFLRQPGRKRPFDILPLHVDLQTVYEAAGLEPPVHLSASLAQYVQDAYGLILLSAPLEAVFEMNQPAEAKDRLKRLWQACPVVHQELLLDRLLTALLLTLAKQAGCDALYLGDSSTRNAIRCVTQTVQGRGPALPEETATYVRFADQLTVVRPLKDHLLKEVAFYAHVAGLPTFEPLIKPLRTDASMMLLTQSFLMSLEQDFPSTVSTVTRTCHKIHVAGPATSGSSTRCRLCFALVDPSFLLWRDRMTITALPYEESSHTSSPLFCFACSCLASLINQLPSSLYASFMPEP